MHDATPKQSKSPTLRQRLLTLCERTGDDALRRLALGQPPADGAKITSEQDRSDWISTCLMDNFKNTGDAEVFGLLFELNRAVFLQAIRGHLRRGHGCIDANDVLQEVFLNIWRYPNHFLADRANAFRSWGHRIVRNAALKFVKVAARQPSPLVLDADDELPQDSRAQPPESVLAAHESVELVNHAYVLYLCLYLAHFRHLSKREQRALTMAEIQGRSYLDIANALGIRFQNVRMVIFRSRQRILRGLSESLTTLGFGSGLLPDAPPPVPASRRRTRTRRHAAHRSTEKKGSPPSCAHDRGGWMSAHDD